MRPNNASLKNQHQNGATLQFHTGFMANCNWLTDMKLSASHAVAWLGDGRFHTVSMISWVLLTMTEILFYNTCAQLIHLFKSLKMMHEHTMRYIMLWARFATIHYSMYVCMCICVCVGVSMCFHCLTITAIILRSLAVESSDFRNIYWTHTWYFFLQMFHPIHSDSVYRHCSTFAMNWQVVQKNEGGREK